MRLRPERQNQVRSYDFVFDRTINGVPLLMLTVIDEYARECLAIDAARPLNSEDVLCRLAELMTRRRVPHFIRSGKGAQFTAKAVREWLQLVRARTLYIERGSPWENAYIESFNSKLRNELLNGEILYALREARVVIELWRREYIADRPHSSLAYRLPAPKAVLPRETASAPADLARQPSSGSGPTTAGGSGLKNGARVKVTVRRLWVAMSSAYP